MICVLYIAYVCIRRRAPCVCLHDAVLCVCLHYAVRAQSACVRVRACVHLGKGEDRQSSPEALGNG